MQCAVLEAVESYWAVLEAAGQRHPARGGPVFVLDANARFFESDRARL